MRYQEKKVYTNLIQVFCFVLRFREWLKQFPAGGLTESNDVTKLSEAVNQKFLARIEWEVNKISIGLQMRYSFRTTKYQYSHQRQTGFIFIGKFHDE